MIARYLPHFVDHQIMGGTVIPQILSQIWSLIASLRNSKLEFRQIRVKRFCFKLAQHKLEWVFSKSEFSFQRTDLVAPPTRTPYFPSLASSSARSNNIQHETCEIWETHSLIFQIPSPLQLREYSKSLILLQTALDLIEPQSKPLSDEITDKRRPVWTDRRCDVHDAPQNTQLVFADRKSSKTETFVDMDAWYQLDGKKCFKSLWVVPLD